MPEIPIEYPFDYVYTKLSEQCNIGEMMVCYYVLNRIPIPETHRVERDQLYRLLQLTRWLRQQRGKPITEELNLSILENMRRIVMERFIKN